MARIIKAVVAIVVVVAVVTGIAFATASYEPAEAATGLVVDGTRVEDPGTMLTIGDYEVSFDEYRYYYMMNKEYVEEQLGGGSEVWASDYDHNYEILLKTSVSDSLKQRYAWLQIAKEMGIELDDEDKAKVQEDLAAKKEEHGSDFEKWLHELYYTDEAMYVRIAEQTALASKAYDAVTAEEQKKVDGESEDDLFSTIATAKHILIMFDEEATDAEQAKEDALVQTEDILKQIRDSEDPAATFEKLMNEYSEDTGLATYPDGYTFGEGEMVDEFYDGTMELDVGEISDPIESTYGYHIIMRLPLDETYVEENIETIKSSAVSAEITELVTKTSESMTVTDGQYLPDVAPDTMS